MTSLINSALLIAKAISRGMSPKPAAMLQVPLNFAIDPYNQLTLNLSTHIRNTFGIAGIQSVKIDNSINSSTTTLTFDNGDVIVCPAYSQAIFPVLFSGDVLSFIAYSAGGVAVNLTFLNTREQAQLWSAQTPIAGAVNVTGSTVYTQPASCAATDRSGVVSAGGTSQTLVAANANRKRLIIQNPSTAAGQNIAGAEYGFFNFNAAAGVNNGSSFELSPGASYDTAGGTCPTDAIMFNAATSGHRFIIKEF